MKMGGIVSLFSCLLLAASTARALEWQPLGARAMGMGGTGVALPQGPLQGYWNPAGLAEEESASGAALPAGAQAQVTGTALEGAKDLSAIIADCNSVGFFGPCSVANITNAINEISAPGSGILLDAQVGLNFKLGGFTFFGNELGYGGANPYVDRVDVNPQKKNPNTGQPNSDYVGNNTSGIIYNGLGLLEIGLGYGAEIPYVPGLYAGANLKALFGNVLYNQKEVLGGVHNYVTLDGAVDHTTVQPGLDLGLLWDANKTFEWMPLHPRLGITARNLTDPKFDQPGPVMDAPICNPGQQPAGDSCILMQQAGDVRLGAQSRAGLSLTPLHFWNITADLDLTRNHTLVNGYKSQMAGVGTEINVFNRPSFNIPLRAGISRNLAETAAPTILSAGFGLEFRRFQLDVSGEIAPQYQTIQSQGSSQKIPQQLGAELQLTVPFGGSKKDMDDDKT